MTQTLSQEPASRSKVIFAFLIVTAIWGSTWLVIKDQVGAVPPSWSITYRFALAGVGMLVLVLVLVLALVRRDSLRLSPAACRMYPPNAQMANPPTFVALIEGCVTSHVTAALKFSTRWAGPSSPRSRLELAL